MPAVTNDLMKTDSRDEDEQEIVDRGREEGWRRWWRWCWCGRKKSTEDNDDDDLPSTMDGGIGVAIAIV